MIKIKDLFSKSKPVVAIPPSTPPKPPEVVAPVIVEPPVIKEVRGLNNPGAFYDEIRYTKLFGPTFSTSEFTGVEEILKDAKTAGWPLAYVAYALATAYHETAHTMQPIKEYGGAAYFNKRYGVEGTNPSRARSMGNVKPGDGAKYCGRGYVQLTWHDNYKRAGKALGVDLVNYPDRAMEPDIASDIMILGMTEGWFTGKSMKSYLPSSGTATAEQYKSARKIINGTDHDEMIALTAMKFQRALVMGEWK